MNYGSVSFKRLYGRADHVNLFSPAYALAVRAQMFSNWSELSPAFLCVWEL